MSVSHVEREASMLVAILVHHPEIGSLRISPGEGTLRLTFLLQSPPGPGDLETLKKRLSLSLTALSRLGSAKRRKDQAPGHFETIVQSYEELALLHIVRDLRSVVFEEFSVIATVVHECFNEALIIDGDSRPVSPYENDGGYVDHFAEDFRSLTAQTLIGFRDGGRVLVFNEPQST